MLTLALSAMLAQAAHAASVGGTVKVEGASSEKGLTAVIWLEGAGLDSSAPKDKPTISQKGIQFDPRVMAVSAGQTVDMLNDDDVAHNVFSRSPAKTFNLGIYPKGETRSVTFDKTGPVDIYCSIHRNMRSTIVVVPGRHHAVAAPGSSWEIRDVPAGEYTLKAWFKGLPEFSRKVKVPAAGKAAVDVELKPGK